MTPGAEVEWRDGERLRTGRVEAEAQPGYFTVVASDGTRFVLPAGRLTERQPDAGDDDGDR